MLLLNHPNIEINCKSNDLKKKFSNQEFFKKIFNCTPIFYVSPRRGIDILKLLLQQKGIELNVKDNDLNIFLFK